MCLIVTKKDHKFFPSNWSSNFFTQLSILLFHTIVQHNFTAKFDHWILNLILPTTFYHTVFNNIFNHTVHPIFPLNSSRTRIYQCYNAISQKTCFVPSFSTKWYSLVLHTIFHTLCQSTDPTLLPYPLTALYIKKKKYCLLYAVYWITYTVYWVS